MGDDRIVHADDGEGVERIDGDGDHAVTFDGRYLAEIARTLRSERIRIAGNGAGAPHTVTGGDEIGSFVLMPMRGGAWGETFEALAAAIPTATEPAPAMGEMAEAA